MGDELTIIREDELAVEVDRNQLNDGREFGLERTRAEFQNKYL